jgi:hypothetical protein
MGCLVSAGQKSQLMAHEKDEHSGWGGFRPKGTVFARILTIGLLLLVGLGHIGQIVRDRSAAWAILMYLPLPLLGGFAILLDLFQRGGSLPAPRFLLSLIGLLVGVVWSLPLIGRAPAADPMSVAAAGGQNVRLLQWNVHWGDGLIDGMLPNERVWPRIVEQITRYSPDVVVLNEAPLDHYAALQEALRLRLGEGWSFICVDDSVDENFRARIAVYASGPVTTEPPLIVSNGFALLAVVRVNGRDVRLLLVDARSDLRVHRAVSLRTNSLPPPVPPNPRAGTDHHSRR